MKKVFALLITMSFAACAALPMLIPAITTLADVAAANNTTANQIVTDGVLICQNPTTKTVQAVLSDTTTPATVVGQTASAVAAVCASLQAAPVPLPAATSAASVPTVVVPNALKS